MNENQWIYHHPVFECDQYNPDLLLYSPWVGHRNFAYDYICFAKPGVVVELGSYYGCSAFAFLQAIKDQGLTSRFYAVDTWCGDDFTKTDYQEDIYGAYKRINDACFGSVSSTMVRKTFVQACGMFEDGSIDLLHIDGSHKYEDVKEDYLCWRSKVAENGVVFFHDVGMDLLFDEPMGSHIYWEELKKEHPWCLEFPFSNGLGMLFSSEDMYRKVKEEMDPTVYQLKLNLQDARNKDMIRKNYFAMRDLRIHNEDLLNQIAVQRHHLQRYEMDSAAMASYIQELEQQRDDLRQRQASVEQQDSDFESLRAFAEGKDKYAAALEQQMEQLNDFANEKTVYAKELEAQIAALGTFAEEKDQYAKSLEQKLEQQTQESTRALKQASIFAQEKECYIGELQHQLKELSVFAESKETYIQTLQQQLEQLGAFADGKERYAADLERQMVQLNTYAEQKMSYASKLEEDVRGLVAFADEKEHYIQELVSQVQHIQADREKTRLQLEESSCRIRELEIDCATWMQKHQQLAVALDNLRQAVAKLPFGQRILQKIEDSQNRKGGR